MGASVGRNEACPCGSGIKYKKCHGRPVNAALTSSPSSDRRIRWMVWAVLGGLTLLFLGALASGLSRSPGRVWSEEHGHWHEVNEDGEVLREAAGAAPEGANQGVGSEGGEAAEDPD